MKRTLGAGLTWTLLAALTLVARPDAVGAADHTHHPHEEHPEHAVCTPSSGAVHCHAHVLDIGQAVTPDVTPAAPYINPALMKSAYNWPTSTSAGAGQTVAIVDAYDDPSAASDLAAFSAQFGLPCNNCLTKVNQSGGSPYPSFNSGWALEISLDIQWAHAIAPGAHILLVEAWGADFGNLGAAEQYAANHANYVSNSWGGGEASYESAYDSYYTHPGVSYFASAGDSGLGAEYPSSSPNVISVGGTRLNNVGQANFSETAWSGGGGGCSSYESPTAAQAGFSQYGQVPCNGARATPDVAADADPNTGGYVYDSYYGGWIVVGGTSLASPLWAARAADAGVVVSSWYVYGNAIPFRDITQGSNGAPALIGYDLATGRGSWADPGAAPPPAPGAPTLTSATGGVGTVTLNWSPPTTGGAVASYNVYRTTSGGPVTLAASGVTGTTYPDNVSPGTYTYQVSAVNAQNLEGPLSNPMTATATAPPPPSPPGQPTLTSATPGTNSITLDWSAPSTGGTPTGYNVYRSTTPGAETIYQTGINGLTFPDTNVSNGVTYYYEVTAVNSAGQGPASGELSATPNAPPPPPPTPSPPQPPSLNTATNGVGHVTLSWSPSSGPAPTSYNLYRGTASLGETLVQTGIGTTSVTDNVPPGTYYYEVTGVNSGGESGVSNELSATSSAATDEAPTVGFNRRCTYSACTFTSTSSDPDGGITSYSWTGGNNLSSSQSQVTHGYSTDGTFAVVLTVTDSSGQQATSNQTVTCARDQYRRLICA